MKKLLVFSAIGDIDKNGGRHISVRDFLVNELDHDVVDVSVNDFDLNW